MYARMYVYMCVCIHVYYVCMHNISGEFTGEKCPTQNGKGIVLREFSGGELSGVIVRGNCPTPHLSVCPSVRPSIHQTIPLHVYLSVFLYVRPSVRPSIHPSLHPSLHPSIHPSIHISIHPSIHPSVCLSVRPTFRHYVRTSIHPSIHPSVHSSINPSVCLSVYLSFYICTVVKKSKLNCLCHICRLPNHRLKFRRYLHNSIRNVIPTHHNILSNR